MLTAAEYPSAPGVVAEEGKKKKCKVERSNEVSGGSGKMEQVTGGFFFIRDLRFFTQRTGLEMRNPCHTPPPVHPLPFQIITHTHARAYDARYGTGKTCFPWTLLN